MVNSRDGGRGGWAANGPLCHSPYRVNELSVAYNNIMGSEHTAIVNIHPYTPITLWYTCIYMVIIILTISTYCVQSIVNPIVQYIKALHASNPFYFKTGK